MGDPFVRPGLRYEPHIEQVMLRNDGTLTADATRDDWLVAQHRDTLGMILQRYDQLAVLGLAENMSTHRLHRLMLERLADPTRKRERD
jgi:splicing factor 3B subunit 5